MITSITCFILVSFFQLIHGQTFTQPEQIHLSIGDAHNELIVTWVTLSPTDESIVRYGMKSINELATSGTMDNFTDGGSLHRNLYIHRVILTGLNPSSRYTYQCGSDLGWSSIFMFHTFPPIEKSGLWSPRFLVFGDMGNVNAKSLARMQEEVMDGRVDVILHVGDFAYDMSTNNALIGDEFMRQIEPIAAYVPYMTCVGNHEYAYNFSNYVSRFSMPKPSMSAPRHNFFYSYNIGPAHIISFSTEFYFFVNYGLVQIPNQFHWLKQDLIAANRPEVRAKHPWIITMAHRPMYCSNSDNDDCTKLESIVRTGIPLLHFWNLENLFYEYGVDVMFWAHEHSYERLWPVYNRKVCNGTVSPSPYYEPKAPVHITTGSAGCSEDHDPFAKTFGNWSAYHSLDYGYNRMRIWDGTSLSIEYVSDDQNGKVVDHINIFKSKHGMGKDVFDCN